MQSNEAVWNFQTAFAIAMSYDNDSDCTACLCKQPMQEIYLANPIVISAIVNFVEVEKVFWIMVSDPIEYFPNVFGCCLPYGNIGK